MSKPKILISNDDGIFAPGIKQLVTTAREIGEVVVVAPEKPQSGMGHAITVFKPLRLQKMNTFGNDIPAYASSGTPADCIKLGTKIVLKSTPDLIVSGINHGSNSSVNVLYSGTMSAAVEGGIEGIPAIGFSYCNGRTSDLSVCGPVVQLLIEHVLKNKLPQGTVLNVNIPDTGGEPFKGIRICRQAKARWVEEFDERRDPSGRKYYWLTGNFRNFDKGEDTDEWALKNNYVAVVPVQYDMTAYHAINMINDWDLKL